MAVRAYLALFLFAAVFSGSIHFCSGDERDQAAPGSKQRALIVALIDAKRANGAESAFATEVVDRVKKRVNGDKIPPYALCFKEGALGLDHNYKLRSDGICDEDNGCRGKEAIYYVVRPNSQLQPSFQSLSNPYVTAIFDQGCVNACSVAVRGPSFWSYSSNADTVCLDARKNKVDCGDKYKTCEILWRRPALSCSK